MGERDIVIEWKWKRLNTDEVMEIIKTMKVLGISRRWIEFVEELVEGKIDCEPRIIHENDFITCPCHAYYIIYKQGFYELDIEMYADDAEKADKSIKKFIEFVENIGLREKDRRKIIKDTAYNHAHLRSGVCGVPTVDPNLIPAEALDIMHFGEDED
ncbi:MAG: hypothetical protein ACXQS5_04195 [Candidatus Methanospirareceae archaeon]